MTDRDERLTAALAGVNAAIYAYGRLGVQLTGSDAAAARAAEAAHRDQRDALLLALASTGATPPPVAPGYTLPFPVTDRASALRLALDVEERMATLWRAALAPTERADRGVTLNGLTGCARRATGWRIASKVTPATVPYPGRPA
ncbi:ferritin-like domain-containing protein [Pilimelia columellifera]|uniref:Ferritin-like domain-containing protein n=1 Tax=Pilimelia columellifera subsp. columellifera TaxID=706583 RepID=A0ABN3N379_9ACTN